VWLRSFGDCLQKIERLLKLTSPRHPRAEN
jgi:hypothetical protein